MLGGDPARPNPEDLLLSALSACHMLWFLHLASGKGIVVRSYEDAPLGVEAARRAGCHIMADIAAGVVQGNSWRQRYAPPRGESAAPYALGAFGFAVVVGAVTAARRWARGVR